MTAKAILTELKALGSDQVKKILLKHGAKEPLYGVKVEHLKIIQKKIKMDYQLAKELYATGNADAMYLAGLIADDKKMTRQDLQTWVKQAQSPTICEYTVAWVAAESQHGFPLALEWIESAEENIAATGWSTLSGLVAIKPDSELDIPKLKALLSRLEKSIHLSPNRVRHTMNGFVISLGSYVTSLTEDAIKVARKSGNSWVNKDGTACQVPDAVTYITKIKERGALGKKKKTVKC